MRTLDRTSFENLAQRGNVVPLVCRLMSDQLTPVLGYRRLVAPDERIAPSFLLESVENGSSIGRYSLIGAQPSLEVIAREHEVSIIDHRHSTTAQTVEPNPLNIPHSLTKSWKVADPPQFPQCFTGGWVGYAGYDTVRYLEPEKLPFAAAPRDDRHLPDMHFGLYRQ